MAKTPKTEAEWHRRTAVEEFNYVWRLIGKKRRTPDEDMEMIHAAHASRFHWGHVGGPKEIAVGEWQISHVYAILGRGEPALFHAQRCLEVCVENGVGDFPLAYAHEALARAHAIAGRTEARERHVRLAREAGRRIAEADDRALFFKDLRTVPRTRHA